MQPRLSAIDGVQRADILGGRTFALRAWLKPDRMAALNVSPSQVRAGAGRQQLPVRGRPDQGRAGAGEPHRRRRTCRSVDEFKKLVIREQDGALVRLEDVADVVLGADDYDQDVRFSGEKAVFMGVWVLPNANSLDVIERVRNEIEMIKHELPSGMRRRRRLRLDEVHRQTRSTRSRKTLIETILIVIVVIFLFLGSLRTVLVPVVAIPVSLIGAVFLMQVFGFTLNLLTLLAIVLAVGLVVDDAIVVVENVERHMREGKTRAARRRWSARASWSARSSR